MTSFPLVATSANRSGAPHAIRRRLQLHSATRSDLLVDSGPTPGGAPSTIVDMAARPYLFVGHFWEKIRQCESPCQGQVRGQVLALAGSAALVGLIAGRARRHDAERSLDELAGLAQAAGADVVLRVLQERPKADAATFLGSGKVAGLAASCAESGVELVVFDNELTPAQLRQIEEVVGRKIIDRTQLILDIFARRARTREGKLQVELAQLMPAPASRGRRSRSVASWRRVSAREDLAKLSSKPIAGAFAAEFTRSRRTSNRCGSAALIFRNAATGSVPTSRPRGYTQADDAVQSTDRGTAAASDALFVTLDPVAAGRLPDNRELLVSDTVRFIERLPHALVAAFRRSRK